MSEQSSVPRPRDTYRHVCRPCEASFTAATKAPAPCPFCGKRRATGNDEKWMAEILGYSGAVWPRLGTQ
jgi:rubrerythrin